LAGLDGFLGGGEIKKVEGDVLVCALEAVILFGVNRVVLTDDDEAWTDAITRGDEDDGFSPRDRLVAAVTACEHDVLLSKLKVQFWQ